MRVAALAHQLRGHPAGALGQHLRGDHVVGPPPVADLPGHVLGVAAGDPVHLVGLDARLVLAVEQPLEPVAQRVERVLRERIPPRR